MTKYVIVQKRWKKILAIILFTCALVGNFLVITVGLNLDFVKKVYQRVTKMGYQKAVHIEDIVYLNPINDISMDTNYLINIYPTNATSTEGKLVFTSMTPEVFTLTKNKYTSYVRSAVFDDEEVHKGILRVTSENDKSFVKDLELCFRKKYDDTFKPIPNRVGIKEDDGSYRVYLDTLFVFSIRMKAGTTEKEFSMDYDESFFDHPTEYAFIPKQEGKTQITIHYYDRKTWTFNLHVLPVPKKDVNGINL